MTERHRRSFTAYDFTAAIKCLKLHLGLTNRLCFAHKNFDIGLFF